MSPVIPLAIMAGATAYSAYSSYESGKSQQKILNAQAKYQQAQGAAGAAAQRDSRDRFIAAQRARLAANGVDVTRGSPLTLFDDTYQKGESDALNIQRGYQFQSDNSKAAGRMALQGGITSAVSSIGQGAGAMLMKMPTGGGAPAPAAPTTGVS